ncbi:MAG: hypothetical protein AB7L91_16180 [Dehalococcoidia bacterium]
MSNTPWRDDYESAIEEIQSIRDPWDRVIAAEGFREQASRLAENLVRYETYRLRLQTGLSWDDMGRRMLVSGSVLERRVRRWCAENDVPVPPVRRSDRIKPETTRDLKHLRWDSPRSPLKD